MTASQRSQEKGPGKSKIKSLPFQEACAKPLSIIKRSLALSSNNNSQNSSEDSSKTSESAAYSHLSQPSSPSKSGKTTRDKSHSTVDACTVYTAAAPAVAHLSKLPAVDTAGISHPAKQSAAPASHCTSNQQQHAAPPWLSAAGSSAAGAATAEESAALSHLPPPTAVQDFAGPQAAAGGPPTAEEMGPQRSRRLADVLLRCGKPSEAVSWAEQALAGSPWDVELVLLKGRCLEAAGNIVGAFSSYMSAINHCPRHLPSLMALASLYKAKGMLEESAAVLRRTLQTLQSCEAPSNNTSSRTSSSSEQAAAESSCAMAAGAVARVGGAASCSSSSSASAEAAAAAAGEVSLGAVQEALAVVLTDLGTRAKSAGNIHECEQLYSEALALCPTYPSVHYNLGVLASEGRRWSKALRHYQDTLALAPHHAQALCNCGVVYRELERLEDAVAAYEAALAVAPNYPIVRTNLAVALTDLGTALKLRGQLQHGIRMYERALALVPHHSDALYNLGVACAEAGQVERAMFCYELTTHFNPQCAEAWNNLGVLHKEADNLERAAECYMAALNIRPNFPQSLNNLAMVLTSQGKAGEALSLLQAAISALPDYAEAHNNFGVLQRDVGAIPDALASYERALALVPDSRNAGQNRLLALNYIYQGEDPAVCAAHAAWGESFQAQHVSHMLAEVTPEQRDSTPGRPLRVGYVTPDLFTHSVSYFAEAPLSHHDKQRVQMYVYSCVAKPDAKTARLRQQVAAAGGVWQDVARLPEPQLAQLIRQDEIDILVELTGHTANNRLGVCAMRPAPIQVTWIGYPNSTGLTAVDYRFTDTICDPLDTKQTFTEELIRLPSCFLCYTPAPDAPPVAPLPAASNGFVTFGSFNNLAKITPQVLDLWARILQSVPASRLVLKAKPFSCPAAKHHVMTQLTAAGVDAWRVDLLPLTAGTGDHLSVYGLMDISLDPFPYAGTTTTTESLYMGVPVITLQGNCHAHNVSCSLLAAVGIADQWVARTPEEYVQLAISHASNVTALQDLRRRLRPQMLASRMCDAKGFVTDLEVTYQRLWDRWVAEGGRRKPITGLQQQQQQQQGQITSQQNTGLQQQQKGCLGSIGGSPLEAQSSVTPAGAGAAAKCAAAAAVDDHLTDAPAGPTNGSSRRCSSDQNCGSRKGSTGSRSLAVVGVDVAAAAAAAAAAGGDADLSAAAALGDGGGTAGGIVHKGRRLSCSCDAAATVHAGAVMDTPAGC